jgi:hypothetical protein
MSMSFVLLYLRYVFHFRLGGSDIVEVVHKDYVDVVVVVDSSTTAMQEVRERSIGWVQVTISCDPPSTTR